ITNYSESSPPTNVAFINNGDETFAQLTHSAIVSEPSISFDASWVDYDNDGLVDLYVTNFQGSNYLYRQDDTGFVQVTDPPIGSDAAASLATAWSDYDSDGDMDLFVANAWGDRHDYLYVNNGDGQFAKCTTQVTIASYDSWGGSWSDYDNDGDQDLFVTSLVSGDLPNSYDYLYVNNGDGTFTMDPGQAPCLVGARTEGSAWGDYNNDGFLDLFVAVAGPNLLYRNQGDGTFIRVTEGAIVTDDFVSRAGAWSDYDRDGDLDLYVANGDYLVNSFYENNGNSNNWLVIECVGVESNRMAIGARVTAKATISGNSTYQMREISSRSGGNCQNSSNVHFGLGDAVIIDSIKVEWPSGATQILTDVVVNQYLNIEEECCNRMTGNVDYDPGDIVDIGDLTALIDFLFISYTEPVCMEEANVDGVSPVDIGDVTDLISYLFIPPYPEPASCE
ncbi:MAG: CRTAC1 family protein, partial [Candidatus Zixiibacteriota bacterium]